MGGAGNRWGVIIGAVVVSYLPELFRPFADYRVLIFGVLLIVLANFRSQGLIPPRRSVRAKKVDERLEQARGRSLPCLVTTDAASRPTSDAAPLLSMQDVTIRFGGVVALDGVTFDIRPGRSSG
ncbi:hypothetical protein GCM10025868_03010 [Angustibacter aerolatus]|uniref:ABC transporter domain-containing protein n=1 Tax=Angustibacter aerolatus TaxID=1162965 RepID=A0ABQ6JBS0_9ACTN|nr:hypothetical protein GCM10025868_03010 [Angustibacter aerolatus]